MHLLACISHHGRGHLAQTAPVLNALYALCPQLRLTVRSGLAREVLAGRIRAPFTHWPEPADCGFAMQDALRVDLEASLAAYRRFHAGWSRRVRAEATLLRAAGFDAVLSNIAYLPLAAARAAGIRAAALCSLNWLDILRHYLGERPAARAIADQIEAAYRSAAVFLRPEPGMPMPVLDNLQPIGPLAEVGRSRRDELRRRLRLKAGVRLVALAMGGFGYTIDGARWVGDGGVHWLVPDDAPRLPQTSPFSATGLDFADILASVDAVLTKPGYGTFVEAAAAGVAVLYLPRPDWPEAPWLTRWLEAHARARPLPEEALRAGQAPAQLQALWAQPARPPVQCPGAREAAQELLRLFG
ncbi:MAG: hypothetical protein N2Z63_01890 [Thiobacillaceae bacterium]|nr:hypothetical protein [Thiobacillaceae bacterium]